MQTLDRDDDDDDGTCTKSRQCNVQRIVMGTSGLREYCNFRRLKFSRSGINETGTSGQQSPFKCVDVAIACNRRTVSRSRHIDGECRQLVMHHPSRVQLLTFTFSHSTVLKLHKVV